jgi:hypothetical protein
MTGFAVPKSDDELWCCFAPFRRQKPMRENFQIACQFVLDHEGGYVNDPDDPGGETNFGIAKRYHPDVDIKSLTKQEAAEIYFKEYWMKLSDNLPFPLDIAAMDCSVNLGITRTQNLMADSPSSDLLLMRRIRYYTDKVIESPVKLKFFFGWMSRVMDLKATIKGEQRKRG